MFNKVFFCISLFTFYFSSIYGVILEVSDLTKFKVELENLDCHSFVLFDIDNTILTPKDSSLKPCGKHLRHQYLHGLGLKQRELLQSIIALEAEEELVDNEFPDIIKRLQTRNIPVSGFTLLETGIYGKIANVEDWRLSQLKKFGIVFSTYYDKELVIFSECSPYHKHFPTYKNGVLFTDRLPKGEVLTAFLKKIVFQPNKILMLDDSLDQIKSGESAANALNIEFIGFHYIAETVNRCGFDQTLGDFQFQNLIKNQYWLPDSQAKDLMK